MQRLVKFRAWDKTSNVMRTDISSVDYDNKGNICQINVSTGADILFPDKEAVLMQYTGLKDKNGVEIYEGDIVRYIVDGEEGQEIYILEVVWIEEAARFDMVGKIKEYLWAIHNGQIGTGEVIGNIWENPELLEAGE